MSVPGGISRWQCDSDSHRLAAAVRRAVGVAGDGRKAQMGAVTLAQGHRGYGGGCKHLFL